MREKTRIATEDMSLIELGITNLSERIVVSTRDEDRDATLVYLLPSEARRLAEELIRLANLDAIKD